MAFYLSKVLEQGGDSLDKGDDEGAHFAFPRRTSFWIVLSDERSSELQWISLVLALVSETRAKTASYH